MRSQQSRKLGSRGLVLALVGAVGMAGLALEVTKLSTHAVTTNASSYAMAAYSMSPAPDLGDLLRRLGTR